MSVIKSYEKDNFEQLKQDFKNYNCYEYDMVNWYCSKAYYIVSDYNIKKWRFEADFDAYKFIDGELIETDDFRKFKDDLYNSLMDSMGYGDITHFYDVFYEFIHTKYNGKKFVDCRSKTLVNELKKLASELDTLLYEGLDL